MKHIKQLTGVNHDGIGAKISVMKFKGVEWLHLACDKCA